MYSVDDPVCLLFSSRNDTINSQHRVPPPNNYPEIHLLATHFVGHERLFSWSRRKVKVIDKFATFPTIGMYDENIRAVYDPSESSRCIMVVDVGRRVTTRPKKTNDEHRTLILIVTTETS